MPNAYQISADMNFATKRVEWHEKWRNRQKADFLALPVGAKVLFGAAAGTAMVAGMVIAAPEMAAAAAFGGVAAAATAVAAWQSKASPVTIIEDPEELKKFTSHQGDEWVIGAYYVEHPKRPKCLISPPAFHETIAKEHMHEIVTFLRSTLPVTHVEVVMEDKKGGGASAEATYAGVTGNAGTTFEQRRLLRLIADYKDPVLVALDPERPLLWKERFKVVHDAVRGASGGSLRLEESVDMKLGLTFELAKLVGIEANWLSTKTLSVDVQFG